MKPKKTKDHLPRKLPRENLPPVCVVREKSCTCGGFGHRKPGTFGASDAFLIIPEVKMPTKKANAATAATPAISLYGVRSDSIGGIIGDVVSPFS